MRSTFETNPGIALLKALCSRGDLGPCLLVDRGSGSELNVVFSHGAIADVFDLPLPEAAGDTFPFPECESTATLSRAIVDAGDNPVQLIFSTSVTVQSLPGYDHLVLVSSDNPITERDTDCPLTKEREESGKTSVTGVKEIGSADVREMLDSLALELVLVDQSGKVIHSNRGFADLLATSTSRLRGCSLADAVASRGWNDLFADYVRRGLAGENLKAEYSFPSLVDGSQQTGLFQFVPRRSVAGEEPDALVILMIDITESTRIRSELESIREKFELSVKDSPIAIWQGDTERPDWIDAKYIERLLGLPPGELNNSRTVLRERIHPDDAPVNESERRKHEDGHGNPAAEIRIRCQNGEFKWFYVLGKSDRDENGNITRLAGTMTNIDRLKNAELTAAAELKRRDQFLAMLSHELRNPVTAIAYSCELLTENLNRIDESDPERKDLTGLNEAIGIINRQASLMSRLLDDLLNVVRITRNRIEYELKVHDLNEDVCAVVDGMSRVFSGRNQQFVVSLSDEPLSIYADEMRLKQVISNLLDNASKYTPVGGRITVQTELQDGNIVLRVTDTGAGIPEAIEDSIFDLFFQNSPDSPKRTGGGLGVGLFIVRNIVEGHGGSIKALSEGEGQGSVFEVRLPPFNQPTDAVPEGIGSTRFQGERVMIVEDNEDSLTILSQVLQLRGLDVVGFADAESALACIQKMNPRIAFIDIGLPQMDGYELAREIRKVKSARELTLVALTGYGQDNDRDNALQSGFDEHMTKPTKPSELCEYIASIVQGDA